MTQPVLLEEVKTSCHYPLNQLECLHETIIGMSAVLESILHRVEQVAPTDTTVLISGEPGTGKELLAREIHRLSSRKHGAIVKINCAAPLDALLESTFFKLRENNSSGKRSAEWASLAPNAGTTLFLDDIDALPAELQKVLLKIMRMFEGERCYEIHPRNIGIRVIAATSKDLTQKVRGGQFHEELWHHLNVFPIELPPLRNRVSDIPLLAEFFAGNIARQMGACVKRIPPTVLSAFRAYDWPDNIRELKYVVERAVITSPGQELCVPWQTLPNGLKQCPALCRTTSGSALGGR